MYDVAILGGGPAGVTASIYAARKKLKTIFLAKEWGGQSNVSADIQNWIGTPHISGGDLAKNFEAHLREYAADVVDMQIPATVTGVVKTSEGFSITTESGETYEAKAVCVATGSRRRKLIVPGADEFEHKGLTYCATCDGPLFTGKNVVVIGGGNAGFETAAQLLEYTQHVTLLEHNPAFKADEVTVAKVMKHEKFTGLTNVDITEIRGEALVNGITYRDNKTGKETDMNVEGIFAEIGMIPNTDMVADLVDRNERNHIITDPYTQRTSMEGVWAAGDCTDGRWHQNNIAAGDAVKAIEDMYTFLR
tara:strand:- start:4142 stop:5059 length:918 start_codon:yes stop_codon:yes gene_type:complete